MVFPQNGLWDPISVPLVNFSGQLLENSAMPKNAHPAKARLWHDLCLIASVQSSKIVSNTL